MDEKKSTRRVLKSVVGPALGLSLATLVAGAGCSTTPPTKTDKQTTEKIPPVGVVEPSSTPIKNEIPPPGIVPAKPTSTPTSQNTPASTPADQIPRPGAILPPPPDTKIPEPGKIHKVGKAVPKPGKPALPPEIRKVGKFEPEGSLLEEASERPTRITRRTTDPDGGALCTGLLGAKRSLT